MSQLELGTRIETTDSYRDKGAVIGLSNGDGYIIRFDSGLVLFKYNREVRRDPSVQTSRAGWTHSAFVGETGGWEYDRGDGYTAVVLQHAGSATVWQALVVRQSDGETFHYSEHTSQAAAMQTAEGRRL